MPRPWSEAQPYLRAAVARGLSANETLRQLQEADFHRRRIDFLAEFRAISGRLAQGNLLKYIGYDKRPSQYHYGAPEYFISKQFRYEVTFSVYKKHALQPEKLFTWITSDSQLTRGQVLESGELQFGELLDRSPETSHTAELTQCWAADWAQWD